MTDEEVRQDWEERVYRRLDEGEPSRAQPALPAPTSVRAEPAVGHVRLSWDRVPDAVGYVIERSDADSRGSTAEILEHGGSDVAAIPGHVFADTGLRDGASYRYRIGAVAGAGQPPGSWSGPVTAGTLTRGRQQAAGPVLVRVHVDASRVTGHLHRVWEMAGSERLTQFLAGDDGHGHDIGSEFAEALRRAHDDLGVRTIRAHAVFHDELGVARRSASSSLELDFAGVDAVYDRLLGLGLRPVVELSFMPAALARAPDQTVFAYRGIVSPPADWQEWHDLVRALAEHLVARYGITEVAEWAFEVWNEPNLEVFWGGTRAEYERLYDEAARAIKGVDRRLRVGGPATSAGEWIEPMARHIASSAGVPLDFVSTHTYGNLPVDLRPILARHQLGETPIWWTEWGVGHGHGRPVHDAVIGAPFILSGYRAAQGRVDALSYWVVSDHFEELGRPTRLFHDGFGLLTIGNLAKPRYWAVHLAADQGDAVLWHATQGDGAEVLVQAWATRHDDGTIDALVWNGAVNAALLDGDPRLDRRIELVVTGLAAGRYRVRMARIDRDHSNVVGGHPSDLDWPEPAGWRELRQRDELHEVSLPDTVTDRPEIAFHFDLPMPGVVRLRLAPHGDQPARDVEDPT